MLDFAATERIYTCNSTIRIKRHLAYHPELFRFCKALGHLHRILGEEIQSNYWQSTLAFFRKYRFRLIANPLPYSSPALIQQDRLDSISWHLATCKEAYSHVWPYADELLKTIGILAESQDNPLLEILFEIAANIPDEEILLVVKEAVLLADIEQELEGVGLLDRFQITRPCDIKRIKATSHTILTGPSYLYPEAMQAMRSENIHILCYAFLRDEWLPKAAFLSTTQEKKDFPFSQIPVSILTYTSTGQMHDIPVVMPEAEVLNDPLIPGINLQRIAENAVSESLEREDTVRARLFLLEEENGVFLEDDADSKALVIDLDAPPDEMVCRIPVTGIEPGQFILLRTEGGGDYIRPLADKLMGEKAQTRRHLQEAWKKRLREKVEIHGLREVSRKLQALGSRIAKPINVYNWMSERNIRTNDIQDFKAIMKLIDLQEHTEDLWEVMDIIDEYHMKAGRRIRRTLLELVREADLKALANYGKMEFRISDEGGGSLTAFRVLDKTPEASRVASGQIGYVFGIEDKLWQG